MPHLLALAVKDYLDGHSLRSAAERVGIGRMSLQRELVRRGIRRRSPNKRAKHGAHKGE